MKNVSEWSEVVTGETFADFFRRRVLAAVRKHGRDPLRLTTDLFELVDGFVEG